MTAHRWCLLVALGAFACTAPTTAEPPTASSRTADRAPTVDEILRRMSERYASAKTYRDEGTLHDRIGDARSVTRIRTLWIAPDQMFFEAVREHDRYFDPERIVIASRGGSTRTLFLDKVEQEPSLNEALYAMQGVSQGTTGLVPRWLLDRGCRCSAKYALEGQEPCGKSACFKLVGEHRGHKITLDIDTTLFALRRYTSRGTMHPDAEDVAEARKRLEMMPPEVRAERTDDAWLASFTKPTEVEEDLVLEPVFDSAIAPGVIEQLSP